MNEASHRVHGVAGDDAIPDWPMLRASEVSELLRHYPQLGNQANLRWHSPRPLSAAALVYTDGGTVFVKRHHRRVRTVATLSEEHRFMAHLRRAGIGIPALIANADGDTVTAIGDWVYEVQTRAAGLDIYRDAISWSPLANVDHARAAGTVLAELHQAAAGYQAAQRQTHILIARSEMIRSDDPIATLHAQLSERPGLADYLRQRKDWPAQLVQLFAPWHVTLPERLQRQPRLWTHGDWHVSNLCWSSDADDARITAVLDFGLAAANFALFDLATAIERNAIAWLELERGDAAAYPHTARALIDGYRQVRPLQADDVHLLADLLPLVHVDFALSEVEYFHAITDSRAHADVAWDTFLLGHAAWFASTSGQALLQAIRDCA